MHVCMCACVCERERERWGGGGGGLPGVGVWVECRDIPVGHLTLEVMMIRYCQRCQIVIVLNH